MNRATFPEMLRCVSPAGSRPDMTVLEQQRASLKWRQQQQQQREDYDDYFGSELNRAFCVPNQGLMVADLANNNPLKLDPGVHTGWPDLGGGFGGSCGLGGDTGLLEVNYGIIPRTLSSPPLVSLPLAAANAVTIPVAPTVAEEEKAKESVVAEKSGQGQVGKESFRKRKVDRVHIVKSEDDNGEKRTKGCTEEAESKLTDQSNNDDCKNKKETNSGSNSKENAKNSEFQKPDYIHVRARRGQATDSHSLAERVRREKISERMKFLQDLVPGCDKITGKAGMLDEIINYVQSLQRQVEFLSMKLAAVDPRLDIDIDSIFAKEITPACTPNFPTIEMSSDLPNHGYLHLNPTNQLVPCAGLELGVNPDMCLWRMISAPLHVTEKVLEAPSFTHVQAQSATWDNISLQNLYNMEFPQGRTMPFPSHQYTGSLEAGTMKIEM